MLQKRHHRNSIRSRATASHRRRNYLEALEHRHLLSAGINVTSPNPSSWSVYAGSYISGSLTTHFWNDASTPNTFQRVVIGIRDLAGNWVPGTTPFVLVETTPSVGPPGSGFICNWSNMITPATPGNYRVVLGMETTASDAAAISAFEASADTATAVVGSLTANATSPGISISSPSPASWTVPSSTTISGSFTMNWWNGTSAPNNYDSLVLGIRDASGHWVGGTVPQSLMQEFAPIGSPGSSHNINFSNLVVPPTAGTYYVVAAEENYSADILAYESNVDLANAVVGTITVSQSATIKGPLFTFPTWNQSGQITYNSAINYNDDVPIDPATSQRSVLGCVATAVSQIEYYWHFPSQITFSGADAYTSMSGTASAVNIDADAAKWSFPNFSTLNAGLANIQFNNSPAGMALLAFANGIKFKADYSTPGTSAGVTASTFGSLGFQSAAGSTDWNSVKPTVISNIQNNQPVMLAISTADNSGHAVVLDGYNSSNDTFHVDLGWGYANDNNNGANDWFTLPEIKAGGFDFTTITYIVYNILPVLPVPTNAAASQGTYTNHVHLSWNASLESTGYEVWRSTTNNPATATKISGTLSSSTLSYDDSAVNNAQPYFYWIRALSQVGHSDFTPTTYGYLTGTPMPPSITAIYLRGTSWTSSYLSSLVTSGKGDATLGYRLPTGTTQLKSLPFANLNQISITFSEGVTISQAALALSGTNLSSYSFSNFSYNSTTHTATWPLSASLPTNVLQLAINSAAVTDSASRQLDGEWTDGTSTQSGNGTAGGNFACHVNILPGDLNQSGTVDLTDLTMLAGNWQQTPPNPLFDTNGDNFVDLTDLTILAGQWQVSLPAFTPSLTQSIASPASPAITATNPTLASTQPVTHTTNKNPLRNSLATWPRRT